MYCGATATTIHTNSPQNRFSSLGGTISHTSARCLNVLYLSCSTFFLKSLLIAPRAFSYGFKTCQLSISEHCVTSLDPHLLTFAGFSMSSFQSSMSFPSMMTPTGQMQASSRYRQKITKNVNICCKQLQTSSVPCRRTDGLPFSLMC